MFSPFCANIKIIVTQNLPTFIKGVSNGLCEHFVSMRALRFILRARAMIKFALRAASTSTVTFTAIPF